MGGHNFVPALFHGCIAVGRIPSSGAQSVLFEGEPVDIVAVGQC